MRTGLIQLNLDVIEDFQHFTHGVFIVALISQAILHGVQGVASVFFESFNELLYLFSGEFIQELFQNTSPTVV